MLAIFHVVGHRHELQRFVAAAVLDVGEPANARHAIDLYSISFSFKLIGCRVHEIIGHSEIHPSIKICRPNPYLVFFNEWEQFLIGDCVPIPNDHKLLPRLDDPREEVAEERERRVRDDDVRLVAQAAHLRAVVVAVAFEMFPPEVVQVDASVARAVLVEHENLAVRLRLFGVEGGGGVGEAFARVAIFQTLAVGRVAGGDEFAQTERLKVLREVAREVAPRWVVARQEHGLAAEDVGVVFEIGFHLGLDVVELGVEFVLLRLLGGGEVLVCHDEKIDSSGNRLSIRQTQKGRDAPYRV